MTQGAFAAIIKNENILLVKPVDWVSQFSGHWNFPGGVVNEGEDLKLGAKREAFEETGINCTIEELIDTDFNGKFDISISVYKAKYISGEIKIQAEEIIDARWFELKEALELPLAFNIKKTLIKLIDQ